MRQAQIVAAALAPLLFTGTTAGAAESPVTAGDS